MKKSFLFFAFLWVGISATFAQRDITTAQKSPETQKTLVKTLDPKGTSIIDLAFKNRGVEAAPWDKGTIRIELEITANFPEAVVQQLIKAGRYTLSSYVEDGVLKVTAKNLEKVVTVGGKNLEDEVKVFAQTPGYYAVENGRIKKHFDAGTVAGVLDRAGDTKTAKKMIAEMSVIKESVTISYRFVYNDGSGDKSATEEAPSLAPATLDRTTGTNQTLKDVQARYGDILISGEPIEFELD